MRTKVKCFPRVTIGCIALKFEYPGISLLNVTYLLQCWRLHFHPLSGNESGHQKQTVYYYPAAMRVINIFLGHIMRVTMPDV